MSRKFNQVKSRRSITPAGKVRTTIVLRPGAIKKAEVVTRYCKRDLSNTLEFLIDRAYAQITASKELLSL